MAGILLSSKENDFLREILMSSMRHYTREIDADNTLLENSIDDDSIELYSRMLETFILWYLGKHPYKEFTFLNYTEI